MTANLKLKMSRQESRQLIRNNDDIDIAVTISSNEPYTNFGLPIANPYDDFIKNIQTRLCKLQQFYMQRHIRNLPIDFICDLIDIARELSFNDSNIWINLLKEPKIIDCNKKYIEDTVSYIIGNPRDASQETWTRLLNWSHESNEMQPVTERSKALIAKLEEIDIDITELWIRRDDGIKDMLFTLYALFCNDPMRV